MIYAYSYLLRLQLDQLRAKVASLEKAIEAKDRENVTNRAMYDNMKGVSRKIKEVRAELRARERDNFPPVCCRPVTSEGVLLSSLRW